MINPKNLTAITLSTCLLVGCGFKVPEKELTEDTSSEAEATFDGVTEEEELLQLNEEVEGLNEENDVTGQFKKGKRHHRIKKEIYAALSETAQGILEQVKAQHLILKSEVETICPRDLTVIVSVKEQIKAIYEDETKSRQEKRTAAMAIKEQNHDTLQAEREAFKSCLNQNRDAVALIKAEGKVVADACLINKGNKGPIGKDKGLGKGKPRAAKKALKSTSPEKIATIAAKLEAKLTSQECSDALAAE